MKRTAKNAAVNLIMILQAMLRSVIVYKSDEFTVELVEVLGSGLLLGGSQSCWLKFLAASFY